MKRTTRNLSAMIFASIALAACGGGGGGSSASNDSTAPDQVVSKQLSGRAIDGYLVNAKVCVDINGNGACDAGEPTTFTSADGSYSLTIDSSVQGKKVIAVITPDTKDLSRPAEFSFPAEFTLSSIIGEEGVQHITPLTTLVAAQVDNGRTVEEAQKAVVTLLGGAVNLNSDYIADNNTAAATLAASMVDKVVEFSKDGQVSKETSTAVFNAIAAKGDVESVNQTDVAMQATVSKFAQVANPLDILSNGLYAFIGAAGGQTVGGNGEVGEENVSFFRVGYKYADGAVHAIDEIWENSSWNKVTPGDYDDNYGEYVMKADGDWSGFMNHAELNESEKVLKVENGAVTIINTYTHNTTTLKVRQANAGNVAFAELLTGWIDASILNKLAGAFSAGSTAYAIEATNNQDLLSLSSFSDCWGTDLISEDGVQHCNYLGDVNTIYNSVDQVIGMLIPAGEVNLRLLANGQAELVNNNGSIALKSGKITWTKYPSNAGIIVLDIKASDVANFDLIFSDTIEDGDKVIIARQNGRLKRGELIPANKTAALALLSPSLFEQLFEKIKQLNFN